MNYRIDRVEGRVMPVNSYVIHGPEGLVVVDGMLTVSDAALVRRAIDESGRPLAGVVVTHPHPDHYAGVAEVVAGEGIPIVATRAVAEVIRRDDAIKNDIVGPMMGVEWPTTRIFPNHTVVHGEEVRLGGLVLEVHDVGPGESPFDSLWKIDPVTVFAGDIAYNGMHAYLADGHWQQWLAVLSRLEEELPADVTLYVGHGPPGGKALLASQRRYVDAFVSAVQDHADDIASGSHDRVIAAMKQVVPSDDLLFLMELSIDPVLASLRRVMAVSDWNTSVIEEFRGNGGKVGGSLDGAAVLLLHTRGARSGQERVHPLMYRRDGASYVVFASNAGAPTNPDWYHNLLAHPEVEAEIGVDRISLRARVANGVERDRLWKAQRKVPQFAEYELATPRQIPVVILEPR